MLLLPPLLWFGGQISDGLGSSRYSLAVTIGLCAGVGADIKTILGNVCLLLHLGYYGIHDKDQDIVTGSSSL